MKIHFAAIMGVDYDLDLSGAWVDYYLHRDFDSYTIVLHQEQGNIPAGVIADFKSWGFRVLTSDGMYSNGLNRAVNLSNVALNLPGSDILVTADCDEFQALPDGTPIPYHHYFKDYDILHGLLEDRYAFDFANCCMDPFQQYPLREEFTGEYMKAFVPPFVKKSEWIPTMRTKILGAPASWDVSYLGSHCMTETPVNARILFNFKVIHFAWRKAAAKKMALKTYYTHDNLHDAFGGQAPQELLDDLDKRKEVVNAI